MRFFFIYITLTILRLSGYAQSSFVIGKIIDSTNNAPINNAVARVFNENKFLGSFSVDHDGAFRLPTKLFDSCTHVNIQALEYKNISYKRTGKETFSNGFITLGVFKMSPLAISLKEVIINHKRRKYRDTVNIDLTNEKFERNVMIDDFLSSEKGFSKDKNGTLFFRGKEVSDIVLNGNNFFGKNNKDIYRYLPTLALSNIEITETDIDSLTNTVMLRPSIKVNLKMKDKFKKGNFGSLHLGYGTSERFLVASDLYKYKNDEQLSLVLNANNINASDNPYVEPSVNFASNGNNTVNKSAKLTYRNLYDKGKLELEVAIKPKLETRKFNSETLRQDESMDQFSKTSNNSSSKTFSIESTFLNLNYRIDSLNTISIRQQIDYNAINQNDSIRYDIRTKEAMTQSQIYKVHELSKFSSLTGIQYQKKFSAKKGRLVKIDIRFDFNRYDNSDKNNVLNNKDQVLNQYFINGNRFATQYNTLLNTSFNEPLGDSGYLSLFTMYRVEKFSYDARMQSDSIASYAHDPSGLTYQYLQPGIKLQKTFDNFTIDGTIVGIINFRKIAGAQKLPEPILFNMDINTGIDYKLNKKTNLSARYSTKLNYPNIFQLTPVNNSFDLISQTQGNLHLQPEVGKRFEVMYTSRKTDSLTLMVTGSAEHYKSKFGMNIINIPGSYQNISTENIGQSNAYDLGFSINRLFKNGKNISYSIGTSYSELPMRINNQDIAGSTLTFNQSISSGFLFFKHLSISPGISGTFSTYQYDNNRSKIYTLTYSDKVSLTIPKIATLSLYPFFNYSHNLSNNVTWAVNGEIKHSLLKGYGAIWIKAYDIFNSFAYINNYFGASYIQSSKYSNLNRYIIFGLNFKFNDIK